MRLKVRHRRSNRPHRMEQIQVEGPRPVLRRGCEQSLARGPTNVRNHEIHSAEGRGGFVDEALDLASRRHIGYHAMSLNSRCSQLGESGFKRVSAPAADSDPDALRCQP